jgi:hypothetical protein
MDLRDVARFDSIFTDIERGMGVEHDEETDAGLLFHRISDIDLEDVPKRSWPWRLFYASPPPCEICGRQIEGIAVRFRGPFCERLGMKWSACFDRETCNAIAQQNELEKDGRVRRTAEKALKKVHQAKINSLQMWGPQDE